MNSKITLSVKVKAYKLTVKLIFITAFIYALLISSDILAATRTASVSGNWNSTATWGGSAVPTSADAVVINGGVNVTVNVNAVCGSVSFANSTSSYLNIIGTNSLAVSGVVTIKRPSTSGYTNALAVGAGTLSCTSLILQGSTGSRYTNLTISTGTVTVSGNITSAGINSQIIFTDAGTINAGGTFLSGTTGTLTASTGTINYNASGAQTITNYAYYNLSLSGSGAKTLPTGLTTIAGTISLNGSATTTTTVGLTINGNLEVNNGTTFTAAGYALTVNGNTNIGNGTSGALTISSSTGTKAFNGDLTISSGATLNNTASNAALTLPGNLTCDGTLNAGTGVYTFSGASKTINGTLTIPSVTISGTIQNNAALTVSTSLAGTGTLTQGSNSFLNLTGTFAITNLSASENVNTINYNGAAQTIKAISYYNLTLSGSGAKTMTSVSSILGSFTLAGTASATAAAALSIGADVVIGSGTTFNAGTYTHNIGEDWTNNGGTFVASTGTINFNGTNAGNINGTATSTFYNLTVNKGTEENTITSNSKAFSVTNNLTVTQGNLILQATDANYNVTNDLTISSNGTLTHSVNWDTEGKLLGIGGSILIDGVFNYTVRSHVQMSGSATETLRTGANTTSAFSILTLINGTFNANGTLKINDNFWAMFNTAGSFHTNGQTVTANTSLLCSGGTVYIDGGTLNITGGLNVGYSGLNGSVIFSSGTLNSDAITIGDGTKTGTFTHSGGTVNISEGLTINTSCSYTCSNSPAINIGGNWTNSGTFSCATSTVTFNGTSLQTITSNNNNFNNITIANSTAPYAVQLGDDVTINGAYTQTTDGLLFIGSNDLTFGQSATNNITSASSSRMIVADAALGSGQVKKIFTNSAGSFVFPIGDNTGGAEYSPVTFNFTTNSAIRTIAVNIADAQHPNLPIPTPADILTRYWNFTENNAGGTYDYTINLNYISGTSDIPSGNTEANCYPHRWNGTSWLNPTGTVNTTNHYLTITGDETTDPLVSSSFSGFNCVAPTISISPANPSTQCTGGNITFTANVSGTSALSYQWFYNNSAVSGKTTTSYQLTSISTANAGTYKCSVSNGCGSVTSTVSTLSVYGILTASATGGSSPICNNTNPGTFTATCSGGTGSYIYQWYNTSGIISGATSNTYNPGNITSSTGYNCIVTSGTCGTVTTSTTSITVYNNLTSGISGGTTPICYNTNPGTFTATGNGGTGSYTYQWYRTPSTIINGATTNTYNPGNITASTGYYCLVTSGTCGTATTSTTSITVYGNLTASISGGSTPICYNTDPGVFSATATGGTGTYTYQWYTSPSSAISGATSSTYDVSNLTATTSIYCVITSGYCGSATTSTTSITVYGNLTAGIIGNAQTICYNIVPTQLSFTTAPTGGTGSYTYQWYNTSGIITGATNNTYTVAALTATTTYYCVVTSGSCGTLTSNNAVITVYNNLTSGTIGSAQTICYNTVPTQLSYTSAPTGGTGSYTYQWYTTPSNIISGATNNTYAQSTLTASNTYYCKVTSGSCGTLSSNNATITVYNNLTATISGGTSPICYNTNPGTFASTATGGTGTYTYQWYASTGSAISGATSSTYNPGNISSTTGYYCAVTSGSCGTVSTSTTNITVYGNLTSGLIGNAQTICYNTIPTQLSYTTAPTGGTGSYIYQWYNTSGIISGATNNSYTPAALTATTTYYCVITSGSCGTLTSNNVTITVYNNLTAGTIGSAQTICYNTVPSQLSYTISPTGGTGSYTYQWYTTPSNIIIGATNNTYTPSSLTTTTTYYCAVTSGSCGTLNSTNITITVYGNLTATLSGGTTPICYNTNPGTITATANGGPGSYTYQWYTSTGSSISNATNSTYNPGNITTTSGYYCVVISGSCGTVSSSTKTIIVYNNLASGISGGTSPICYNTSPGTFTATGSGASGTYTYQWYNTSGLISGATNNTFNPGNITANTGYYCLVTSGSCGSVTTPLTSITVYNNLTATISGGTTPICYNTNPGTLTTTASGATGSYTYQWYTSPSNIILGATNSTYNAENITSTSGYYCIVTSGTCLPVTTSTTNITVYGNLSATISGGTTPLCYNTNPGTFTATGTGASGSYTYQWYNIVDSQQSIVSGATSNTYNPGNITKTTGYYCVVTSGTCGTVTTTSTTTINVYGNLTAGTIGNSQTICYNTVPEQFSFITAPTGGTETYTYKWYNNSGQIIGATSNTYTSAALTSNTDYYCVITSGICGTLTTNNIRITINPLPQGSLSSITPLCSGNTGQLILTTSSGTVPFDVIYNDGIANRTAAGVTSANTFNVFNNPNTTTNYSLVSITDANGCIRSSGFTNVTATINVNPSPTVSVVPTLSTICYGASTTLTATNSGGTVGPISGTNSTVVAGNGSDPQTVSSSIILESTQLSSLSDLTLTIKTSHTWGGDVRATLNGPCGTSIIFNNPGGTSNGNDLISSGNYIFTTGSSNTFPGASGGQIPTGTYKATFSGINIFPTCSDAGGTWTLTLSTTSSGNDRVLTLHNWSISIANSNVYTTTISGPEVIGAISYSGTNNINATANITPPSGINQYVAVTTDGAGCTATATTNVTVMTLPEDKTPTGTTTICSGQSANILIANSQTGVNYQLRNNANNANVGSAVAGTGATINLPTGNLNSTTTFNVLATNTSTSCNQQMSGTITITVNPVPVDNAGADKSICYGLSTTIGATTTSGRSYSWSPETGLNSSTISNPTANPLITTTYTLTETIITTGCASSNNVVVTVNPLPIISITQSYCATAGKVQLSSNVFSSYNWNTGENTQTILVDLAGIYTITATNSFGCTNVNAATVAVELVTNGDFSDGDAGFTSQYTNTQQIYSGGSTGLLPEGLYSIGSNANVYHPNFFGTDHTNPGTGKFMIVNGYPNSTTVVVWSQEIKIQPYTTYYFSAFAMSVNNVSPYAQLQFAVNGVQVGTVDNLTAGASSNSGPFNWSRFYGTWTSGASTSATLSIVDLNPAAGGNDFAIDDISCSTLTPIAFNTSPSGGGSTICQGSTFSISSNVKGIAKPFTFKWSGPNSYTSTDSNLVFNNAIEAMSGYYSLTVTDSKGCKSTGTTSVIVNPIPTVVANISSTPICNGSSINLTSSANTYTNILLSQNFNSFSDTWNEINNSTGGTPANSDWTLKPSGYLYSGTSTTFSSNDASQFYLSNSRYQGSGGTTATILQSPALNTTGYTTLTLDFYHYFRYNSGETAKVDVSTNGSTWITLATYSSTQGTSTAFAHPSINLNSYVGNATLYIRFKYDATNDYFWAIDNITLTGLYSIYNYSWSSNPSGYTSSIQNPTEVTPTVTTTYSINYSIPANGCSNSAATSVAVNYAPSISSHPASSTICLGTGNTDFTVTAIGTALSYKWQEYVTSWTNVNDGGYYNGTTTSTLTLINPPLSMNGNKYRCIISGTCAPIATSNGSAILTVYPRPTSVLSGTATICNGGSTNISVALTGTQPWSITYTDGTTAVTINDITSSPKVISVAPSSTKTYTITAVSDANCSGTGADMTGNAVVTINPRPTSVISGTATICNGGVTNLSVALTGTLPWSITYTDGTTPVTINGITSSPKIISVSPTSTKTYTITALSDSKCSAIAADMTGNAVITVNTRPTSVLSGTTTICNGGSTNISVALTGTQPWSITYTDGTTPITINGITTSPKIISVSPISNKTYSITAISDANCSGTGADMTGNAVVTVNARPTSVISGTATICSGGLTNLSVALTGTQPWSITYTDGTSPVTINGITTSPKVISVSPSTNKTYSITAVSNPNCSATGADMTGNAVITVNTRPASVLSGTATICNGGSTNISVALTGTQPWSITYTDGTTPVTINGITSSPKIINVSPSSTKTYTITSVTDSKCNSTVTDMTGNAVVTVNPRPTSIISGTATICNGGSTNISVALTGTQPWSITYTDGNTPVTINGITTSPKIISVSPASSKTYTITAVSDANCSTIGADMTGNAVVTVYNKLTSGVVGNSQSICYNDAVVPLTFTSVPTGGTGSYTYQWYSSSSEIINGATNSSYSPSALTSTNSYYCAVTSGSCGTLTSNIITITVKSRPTSVISGTTNICNGGSANLSIALTGTQPWNLTYTDGTNSYQLTAISSQPAIISVSPTSTKTYIVTAVSDANCSATGANMTGNAVITVNPRPTSVISGTATICNGGSTNLSVALTGTQPWNITYTDGTNSYQLSAISSQPAIIIVSPSSTKTYSITAVSDAYCAATGADMTGNAVITVNPRPTSVISGTATICNGGSTNLSVALTGTQPWNITYTDGTNSYQLSSISSQPAIISVSPTSNKTYTVIAVSDANCAATVTDITGNAIVTVNEDLTASINGGTSPICYNTSAGTFTTTCSGGSGLFSYQWFKNNGIIAGATKSSYTAENIIENTEYHCLVSSSSCGTVVTNNINIKIYGNLTAGYWTGCKNERWEEKDNWGSGELPNISTDVLIPSTAKNQPIINIAETGMCKNLNIESGSSLMIKAGGILNVLGNINIDSYPDGILNNSGLITLSGDLINHASTSLGGGELILNGTVPQNISGTINLGKLSINNNGNYISNNGSIIVDNQIKFIKGVLNTTDNNILTLTNNAKVYGAGVNVSGANDQSYVNGPMIKTGNSSFIFPIGKSSSAFPLHPLAIQLQNSNIISFKAEYFNSTAINTDNVRNPINRLNKTDYWNLTKLSGNNNAYVSLFWRNLTVLYPWKTIAARYDSINSLWTNKGCKGYSGNIGYNSNGSVKSDTTKEYGLFAVGNINPGSISISPLTASQCIGTSITFTAATQGIIALSYQWYKKIESGELKIENATNNTFKLVNITEGDAGTYFCVASNNWGNFTSNISTLIVSSPLSVNITPNETAQCLGTDVTFTANVSGNYGNYIFYQWYSIGKQLKSETNITLVKKAIKATDANQYYCAVSNICGTYYSSLATLSIKNFHITSQPTDALTHTGGNVKFSLSTDDPNASYRWIENGTNLNDGGIYSGSSTSSLTLTNIPISKNNIKYKCNVTFSECGIQLLSNSANLTVKPTSAPGIWTGFSNDSWDIGSNWDTGVVH